MFFFFFSSRRRHTSYIGDWSSDVCSSDLSTAFYSAFKEQNPGNEESVSLKNFLDTIGGGIDNGFEQARDILEGLKVLEDEVASNIDNTYGLVHEKLSAFKAMIRAQAPV